MEVSETRPAQLAGTWYTGSRPALQQEVEGYIRAAEPAGVAGQIVGLVVPHAGHRYSGPVAGYAYRAIGGRSYDTVVVISPFHRGAYHPLLTSAHRAYETPLGSIPIDLTRLAALEDVLEQDHQLSIEHLAYDQEHAIEIQLPFLQQTLTGEFALLPLMLSGFAADAAIALGEALGKVLAGSSSLLVASTDLSHFYTEDQANRLDQCMLKAIAGLEVEDVLAVQRSGQGQACGVLAVVSVMTAAKALGAARCQILNYATSGAVSGDYNRVVGYGAGVITRQA